METICETHTTNGPCAVTGWYDCDQPVSAKTIESEPTVYMECHRCEFTTDHVSEYHEHANTYHVDF